MDNLCPSLFGKVALHAVAHDSTEPILYGAIIGEGCLFPLSSHSAIHWKRTCQQPIACVCNGVHEQVGRCKREKYKKSTKSF